MNHNVASPARIGKQVHGSHSRLHCKSSVEVFSFVMLLMQPQQTDGRKLGDEAWVQQPCNPKEDRLAQASSMTIAA